MNKIRIITDSSSEITQEEAKKLGIVVLPISVSFGEEQYYDGVDITPDVFYEKLVASTIFPKTAQISPHAYETAFQEAMDAGEDVLCIPISRKISGSHGNALTVLEKFDSNRIKVLDSLNICVTLYVLVRYAVKLRDEGKNLQEIYDELEVAKHHIAAYALCDTLEYLKKGGRISAASASVGTLLSIKPIITVSDGVLVTSAKEIGRKKAYLKFVKLIKSHDKDLSLPIVVSYSGGALEEAKEFIEKNKDMFGKHINEINLTMIGPTVGAHIGPGALAFACFKKYKK